jgi:tripartite-type tricarboxylate transporter receptor subunit TctC
LVVPFPPGGGADVAARIVAKGLVANGVVIDNRAGATGMVGARVVRDAAPDGYTLLWAMSSVIASPMISKNGPIKSMEELQPVASAANMVFGMFVSANSPVRSLSDFVKHARNGESTFASVTNSEHMAAAKFMQATGITMARIGYKGAMQVMPDLVAGRVTVQFAPVGPIAPLVRDGRLRFLAVLDTETVVAFPDVPTMAESGFPSVSVPNWQGIFAPKGTPVGVVNLLGQRVLAATQNSLVRRELELASTKPNAETAPAFARMVAHDTRVWRDFIRDYNIPVE